MCILIPETTESTLLFTLWIDLTLWHPGRSVPAHRGSVWAGTVLNVCSDCTVVLCSISSVLCIRLSVCVSWCPCSGDGVPSALRPGDRTQPPLLGQHQRSGVGLHQRCGSGHGGKLPGKPSWHENTLFLFFGPQMCADDRLTAPLCLSGRSRQISALRGSRSGVSSRAAVRVPAVCAHLPGGRDRPRLLDGPLQSGSGTGSYGLPRPQYPQLTAAKSSVLFLVTSEHHEDDFGVFSYLFLNFLMKWLFLPFFILKLTFI